MTTFSWPPSFSWHDLDGRQIRVATVGSGPPLLLLNGIGANIEMWEAFATQLAGRRLVMVDVPGTGGSPTLARPLRMPALAQLLVALLDDLELATVDVLGYSWGGALAQQLARQAPERVRALVLAATMPGLGGRPPAPWVIAAMSTPLRYWSPTYLRLIAPLVYGAPVRPDAGHPRARQSRPPSTRGYVHQLYAITGWSSRPWLRQLAVPTLVLAGHGDRLAPVANSRLMVRAIPGARLVLVPGGHLFLLQGPERAAHAVAGFLDSL